MEFTRYAMVAVCMLLAVQAHAQRVYTNSFYMQNPFGYNPGYTGMGEGLQAVVQAGSYMQGLPDGPRSALLGINAPSKSNMGIGGMVLTEQNGAFESFTFQMSGAYKAYFADEHFVSFGISSGVARHSLNLNRQNLTRFVDTNDPFLSSDFYDHTAIQFRAGAWYVNKALQIGISFPYLYEGGGSGLMGHFNTVVAYKIVPEVGNITLQPSAMLQLLPIGGTQVDASVLGEWNERIWGQVGYRSTGSMLAGVGIRLKELAVGYNFGIATADQRTLFNNSHEILVVLSTKRVKKEE